jgi:hypothetical protein
MFRMRRTNRTLFHVLSYPRSMLDIARPADAALLANLSDRLDDLDMRTETAVRQAPRFGGDCQNGRISRQDVNVDPAPLATRRVRACQDEPQRRQVFDVRNSTHHQSSITQDIFHIIWLTLPFPRL